MIVSKNIFIIWLLTLFLLSCNQKGNKSSSNFDKNQRKEELLKSNIDSITLNAFSKFPSNTIRCPDSSFAVDLQFSEKQLDKFIIYYSNDTNYSFSIKLPQNIIGEMNYKTQIWKNDTSLLFPNVGETRDGILQLYIYKHGNYYFKHKKKKVQDEIFETESVDNSEIYDKPIITEQSTFMREGEMLKFEYHFASSGPRNIGCGGSSENWSLFAPANLTEFEFHKQEIENSKFEYTRSGGNNLGHLVQIVSGTIKGKYLHENKWKILLDLKIIINDARGNYEIQINRNQIFNPK